MKCQRDPSCVRDDDHADLCVLRIDGSVILKRRTPAEVGADFTYARDRMQRSKAIRILALAAQDAGDSGWRDENTSPRHTVPHPNVRPTQFCSYCPSPGRLGRVLNPMPDGTLWCDACGRSTHPKRHPEAEAQIAAAHQPPDAFETAMQTGVDDALEEHEEHARREHAKQATDPSSVFAIPGSGTADYASAPIAGTYSIGTGRQYKAVQVDAANLLDTSTLDPDDTVTRGDRALMYADAADCEAAYLRLSHSNRPGYWANDGTLRWVDGMPPIAEWLKMHGFPREGTRPKEPSVVLTGSDLDTFESFSRCAAALQAHAEQGQALQIAYRNALQAVSAMAARRNRGR